ncbi:hypothetical protein ACLOJK_024777 [Asimina triloba]
MAQPALAATQAKPPTRRSKILRCIIIIALTFLVALRFGVLTNWPSIRPSQMVYVFEDGSITHGFAVKDGSIHGYDLRCNTLNATFKMIIEAFNPIRTASVDYDSIKVQVWFQDQMIAIDEFFPNLILKYNQIGLNVRAVAGSVPLQEHVLKEFKHQKSSGHVELKAHMQGWTRFEVGV